MKKLINNRNLLTIVIALLLVLTMHFSSVKIFASTINYYDIVTESDYVLTNENLDDIGFSVEGQNIDNNQIEINKISDTNYQLSYSGTNYSFDAIVEVSFSTGVASPIRTQRHTLEINDSAAIINSGSDIATCVVNNNSIDNVDVTVSVNSDDLGIHGGQVSCESSLISSNTLINVLNVDDESQYLINGNNAIYAQSLHVNEEESITDFSNEEILEKINAQSTISGLSISSLTDNSILISDGFQTLQVPVLEDLAPEIKFDKYYQINEGEDFNLLDNIEITDDYNQFDELDIEYQSQFLTGINLNEVQASDNYGNTIKEEIVLLVNNGNYLISNDEKYIYEKTLTQLDFSEQQTMLDVFSIDNLENQSKTFDINIIKNEQENLEIKDVENSYIKSDNEINSSKSNVFLIFAIFIALFIILVIII